MHLGSSLSGIVESYLNFVIIMPFKAFSKYIWLFVNLRTHLLDYLFRTAFFYSTI